MIYVTVGSLIFGVLGVAYAVTLYYELWKWARECQHSRILLTYKGKVKLNAPLVEWLLWIRQLDKDKDNNGRVVYTYGGTAVAIVKKGDFVARGPIRELSGWLHRKVATVVTRNKGATK